MESISFFIISYSFLIPAYVYWCRDKKAGRQILTTWSAAMAFNSIIKLTACSYRPWIRDSRIMPAGDAIKTATGYSFPSGHSVYAATLYGTTARWCRKNNKKIISILLIIAAILTGFSRNFLGVHTPQDVVVGLAEGFIMIFVIEMIYARIEEHPEKMDKYIAGGAGLFLIITYLRKACITNAGPVIGRVLFTFLFVSYIMFLVPFALKMSAGKRADDAAANEN